MEKLFENEDFVLSSTGHDYDFVGVIETKCDEPLTFFFSEELLEKPEDFVDDYDDWDGSLIDEDKTELIEVCKGLKEYDETDGDGLDEEQDTAMSLGADSYFRTRDDKWTGFLSEPRERGQFLALVKHYCQERLKDIPWT